MLTRLLCLTSVALASVACAASTTQAHPLESEIVYQIFPRSYRDSNGDRNGDFNGIIKKLPYLKRMGITSILINPIFKAREYHNYFADDFFSVDPTFGSNSDFFRFIQTAHSLRLKVILDMEIQYVADKHSWLAATLKDPQSPLARNLWTKGSAFYDLNLNWWGGAKIKVAAINPDSPAVIEWAKGIFRFWAAPNGHPQHGVDGFRIDHMMDDLDNLHVKTGMLSKFWLPIEQEIRGIKPNIFFLAEQSDWGSGSDHFKKANVDAVYGFPLYFAIKSLQKEKIAQVIAASVKAWKPRTTQFNFIENHDVSRFASIVKNDSRLLRLGAVLNLTLKGTPLIYYGQELGMKGVQGKWDSDANDIPVRLAYRWNRKIDAPGTANFYRGSGPWDNREFESDNDGISVEEEDNRPDSLLNFYRRLIKLRQGSPALAIGTEEVVPTTNSSVLIIKRAWGKFQTLIIVNLSAQSQTVSIPTRHFTRNLMTGHALKTKMLRLSSYGFKLLGVTTPDR